VAGQVEQPLIGIQVLEDGMRGGVVAKIVAGTRDNALKFYERAAANAPSRGSERAWIFREYGMLLRKSGDPNATDLAIEKFETAIRETPNDQFAIHALATMFERKGHYSRVIELLEPLLKHPSRKTRELSCPSLVRAYERTGQKVKAATIRDMLERGDI
jgi:tetratricopeptide (TPR) repeat protein